MCLYQPTWTASLLHRNRSIAKAQSPVQAGSASWWTRNWQHGGGLLSHTKPSDVRQSYVQRLSSYCEVTTEIHETKDSGEIIWNHAQMSRERQTLLTVQCRNLSIYCRLW
jgi:hypothetical protein